MGDLKSETEKENLVEATDVTNDTKVQQDKIQIRASVDVIEDFKVLVEKYGFKDTRKCIRRFGQHL